MAASPSPLVWDFYREIGNDVTAKPGGTVHYYDQSAQTIFLNSGLKTRLAQPVQGQWESTEYSFPSQYINDVAYTELDIDHPANGTLYMCAIAAGKLQFIRYQYAADLSGIAQQASYKAQVDNQITQINGSIKNVSNDMFSCSGTLFNPGAKLVLGVAMGDSEIYPIGAAYLDDSPFDPQAATVQISGRNAIGYFLKETTFGMNTHFEGLPHEIAKALFDLAGVPKYIIPPGTGSMIFDFKPEQTILSGLEMLALYHHTGTKAMQLAELPDGTVVFAYEDYIATLLPNTYYSFSVGRDIFKRKTKKSCDGVYSGVYVTGQDAQGNALQAVLVPVENYSYWNIPNNKYLHLKAPDGWVATQADLQWWAENEARKLKFTGIGENFTSPLRPQLLVGDVAEAVEDGVGTVLGVVTEVTHALGERGFETQFSVDSGGEITGTTTVKADIGGNAGYNRKTRLSDMIRNVK